MDLWIVGRLPVGPNSPPTQSSPSDYPTTSAPQPNPTSDSAFPCYAEPLKKHVRMKATAAHTPLTGAIFSCLQFSCLPIFPPPMFLPALPLRFSVTRESR